MAEEGQQQDKPSVTSLEQLQLNPDGRKLRAPRRSVTFIMAGSTATSNGSSSSQAAVVVDAPDSMSSMGVEDPRQVHIITFYTATE
jgi:hypothetical protein